MKKLKEIIILFSKYFIEIPIWKLGIIQQNHNIWRKKLKEIIIVFQDFYWNSNAQSLELFNEITISGEKN